MKRILVTITGLSVIAPLLLLFPPNTAEAQNPSSPTYDVELEIGPELIFAKGEDVRAGISASVRSVVVSENPIGIVQKRIPVLYVVDSGIQPIVPPTGTSGWHPEFKIVLTGTPGPPHGLLQGRMSAANKFWPWSGGTGPWSWTPLGAPLNFNGSNIALSPEPTWASGYADPHRDKKPHATMITSAAIGASTGVLGKFVQKDTTNLLKVGVESIRVAKDKTPPLSDWVVEGIYKAVNAHLARKAADTNAASVLLLCYRSTVVSGVSDVGFDESLELALVWAAHKGVTCIVSAGNTPGTAANNTIHSPDWTFFDVNGNINPAKQTSPSGFDTSPTNPGYWPNPSPLTPSGEPIPRPVAPYMVLVGGQHSNDAAGTGAAAGWRTGATGSSRGPGVEIIAPSLSVPCAKHDAAGYANVTGTSVAAGFVAGVAMVYLASQATAGPTEFRQWLLPTGVANLDNAPCKVSTATAYRPSSAAGGNTSPYYGSTLYDSCVPKLLINTGTKW